MGIHSPKHSHDQIDNPDDGKVAASLVQAEANLAMKAILRPSADEKFKADFKEKCKHNHEGNTLSKIQFDNVIFDTGTEVFDLMFQALDELEEEGISLDFGANSQLEFHNCTMKGADLSEWPQDKGSLSFINTSLESATFANSYLEGVVFESSNLTRANLHGANLREAFFNRSNLIEADLKNTQMTGAILHIEPSHQSDYLFGTKFDRFIVNILPSLVQFGVEVPENYDYN